MNPAAKRLLMAHAFESGVRRVQYKVDAINARSRAAVLKLGAIQEGILRQDRVTWTGRLRDTVVFSILADEWPAVREQAGRAAGGLRLAGQLQRIGRVHRGSPMTTRRSMLATAPASPRLPRCPRRAPRPGNSATRTFGARS